MHELNLPSAVKTFLRFLAIGAFISIAYLALYNVPWFWIEQHMSEYPEDIQKRSYLLDGMCGEGTTFACPSPALPTFRGNNTLHVTPDGKLYLPPGVELPAMVPLDKGAPGAGKTPAQAKE